MATMTLKKETKRTCVYETDAFGTPVSQVYVDKTWLHTQTGSTVWPKEIELTIAVKDAK